MLQLLLSLLVLLGALVVDARPVLAFDTLSPTSARVVTLAPDQIVPIYAKVRYTTLLTFPDGEEIVDVTCGDREFWLVSVHPNARVVSLKPAKVDAQSNLNVLTTSGHVYAFTLQEVSKRPEQSPDLSVHVQRDPLDIVAGSPRAPRFVPAAQVDDLQRALNQARAELDTIKASVKQQIDTALAQYRATYPASLKFGYRYKAARGAFRIRAMFHDTRFTYIQFDGNGELPAIYEERDGGPALVHFDVNGRTYIVGKVLDRGYLAIGRERLPFVQEAR